MLFAYCETLKPASECIFWQEAKKGMAFAGKINVTPIEEKSPDEEPLVYANKLVLL